MAVYYKLSAQDKRSIIEQSGYTKNLNSFLNDSRFIQPKGSPATNIICLGKGCYYIKEKDDLNAFYELLEQCRRNRVAFTYCEKQKDPSGIFLDFDVYQKKQINVRQFNDQFFKTICRSIASLIRKMFVVPDQIHMGVTLKSEPEHKTLTNGTEVYSDGFHILVPGVQLTRAQKIILVNQINKTNMIDKIISQFKNMTFEKIEIDTASAYVSSFFVGCPRKLDKLTHELAYAFNIDFLEEGLNIETNQHLRSDNPRVNLIYEFSLNHQMDEKMNPVIKKVPVETKVEFIGDVNSIGAKAFQQANDAEEEEDARLARELNLSMKENPGIVMVKKLLDILQDFRAKKFAEKFKVTCILAGLGEDYKDLCEEFWRRDLQSFKVTDCHARWREIRTSNQHRTGGFTLRTLHSMAREDNREAYKAIISENLVLNLHNMINQPIIEGHLTHRAVADIIYQSYQHKFVVDYPEGARSEVWYELMLPGDRMQEGQLYKWVMLAYDEPTNLVNYICTNLAKECYKIYEDLKKRQKHLESDPINSDPDHIKWLKAVITNLAKSYRSLGSTGFVKDCIKMARYQFRRPNFAKTIDMDDDLMGVSNGILKFYPNGRVELLTGETEYPVMKYSTMCYTKWDPKNNKNHKNLLLMIRSMFLDEESDKVEYLFSYISLALTGHKKPPLLLLLYGGGKEGKSTIMEVLRKVFGPYSGKGSIQLITGNRVGAGSASPEKMNVVGKHFLSFEEVNKGEVCNSGLLKELLSGEVNTARGLYKDQIEFLVKCIMILPLNFLLKILTMDFATWRRLLLVKMNIKFFDTNDVHYDPNNPYHKVTTDEVKKFMASKEFPEAMLSYLVFMWQLLQVKYQGNLDKIPKPHIDADTAEYRSSQDTIDNFITARMVKTNPDLVCRMVDITARYVEYINAKTRTIGRHDDDLDQSFINSKIGKYFETDRTGKYIKGVRFLKPAEDKQPNEEFVFSIESQEQKIIEQKAEIVEKSKNDDHKAIELEEQIVVEEAKRKLENDGDAQRIYKDAKRRVDEVRHENGFAYLARVIEDVEFLDQYFKGLEIEEQDKEDPELEEERKLVDQIEFNARMEASRKDYQAYMSKQLIKIEPLKQLVASEQLAQAAQPAQPAQPAEPFIQPSRDDMLF
jgi:phage/plasmid-associated DNA primase